MTVQAGHGWEKEEGSEAKKEDDEEAKGEEEEEEEEGDDDDEEEEDEDDEREEEEEDEDDEKDEEEDEGGGPLPPLPLPLPTRRWRFELDVLLCRATRSAMERRGLDGVLEADDTEGTDGAAEVGFVTTTTSSSLSLEKSPWLVITIFHSEGGQSFAREVTETKVRITWPRTTTLRFLGTRTTRQTYKS